ncbi:hypothetical protein D9758_009607 [Tetrapyrgos nigripes]|uniref:SET domain-containing protein n=1 Tax=Tetrapyrgos nigripes TaxID=182062 RepID=A0A8H5LMF0_9AGAR|nr:hypothetical protein D9758_009607 [Tetrapyrgos nigripes]
MSVPSKRASGSPPRFSQPSQYPNASMPSQTQNRRVAQPLLGRDMNSGTRTGVAVVCSYEQVGNLKPQPRATSPSPPHPQSQSQSHLSHHQHHDHKRSSYQIQSHSQMTASSRSQSQTYHAGSASSHGHGHGSNGSVGVGVHAHAQHVDIAHAQPSPKRARFAETQQPKPTPKAKTSSESVMQAQMPVKARGVDAGPGPGSHSHSQVVYFSSPNLDLDLNVTLPSSKTTPEAHAHIQRITFGDSDSPKVPDECLVYLPHLSRFELPRLSHSTPSPLHPKDDDNIVILPVGGPSPSSTPSHSSSSGTTNASTKTPYPYTLDHPLRITVSSGCISGLGMFAKRPVRKGEVVCRERAVVVVANSGFASDFESQSQSQTDDGAGRSGNGTGNLAMVETVFKGLKGDVRRFVEGLGDTKSDSARNSENAKTEKTAEGILKTNAFDVELGGQMCKALFVKSARCNHSCGPSALPTFNPSTLTLTLHANRDLRPGDEITVPYLSVSLCVTVTVTVAVTVGVAIRFSVWCFHDFHVDFYVDFLLPDVPNFQLQNLRIPNIENPIPPSPVPPPSLPPSPPSPLGEEGGGVVSLDSGFATTAAGVGRDGATSTSTGIGGSKVVGVEDERGVGVGWVGVSGVCAGAGHGCVEPSPGPSPSPELGRAGKHGTGSELKLEPGLELETGHEGTEEPSTWLKHIDALGMCYGALGDRKEFIKWVRKGRDVRWGMANSLGNTSTSGSSFDKASMRELKAHVKVLDSWLEDPKVFPLWGWKARRG